MLNGSRYILGGCYIAMLCGMAGQSLAVDYDSWTMGSDIPATSDQTINVNNTPWSWRTMINLPAWGASQALLTISSTADNTLVVNVPNSDIGTSLMRLNAGSVVRFRYDTAARLWRLQETARTPADTGSSIPGQTSRAVYRYTMYDGNWTPRLTLPVSNVSHGAIAVIDNAATYATTVATDNFLFPVNARLKTGDKLTLVYNDWFKKWTTVQQPVNQINLPDFLSRGLAGQTAGTYEIKLYDGNWAAQLKLPASAPDRTRLVLSSDATYGSEITAAALDTMATLRLLKGNRYEFLYDAPAAKWVLLKSPERVLSPVQVPSGVIPATVSPVTRFSVEDGNWVKNITLPVSAKPDDRIIVRSEAGYGSSVITPDGNFSPVPLNKGDIIRFVRTASNRWVRETSLMTVLTTYGVDARAQMGDAGVLAKHIQSVNEMNLSLENSRANFYVKRIATVYNEIPGRTGMPDSLFAFQAQAAANSLRQKYQADMMYFESGEADWCGYAYVGPARANMFAVGSSSCSSYVLRHELGHTLGLNHAWDATGGSRPYAKGYSNLPTIMGDNAVFYYSTPKVYDSLSGAVLGNASTSDSVRAMNDRSGEVAGYY